MPAKNKTKTESTNNPILQYAAEINSGNIIVCNKIQLLINHLVDIVNNKFDYMYYSETHANHAIDFLQRYCTHIKGKMGGKPLQLMLWQKALVAATFGILNKDTGLRHFKKLSLIVAKKNGKSLLSSGIGLYLLTADGEAGAEVYSVATKREQAKIIWDVAVSMVRKSKALSKRCQCKIDGIYYQDSVFKPLSSDYNSNDGLNVHGALLDEIHQWINGRKLYDIIVDGTVNREQPLTIITSTAGYIRNDLFDSEYADYANTLNKYVTQDSKMYDDTVLPFVYELDTENEINDEKMWIKANPGLGVIKNLDNLRTKVKNARSKKSELRNILCKDFNVVQTGGSAYMSYSQCQNTALFDINELKPDYVVGGVDLARTTDLCSAKAIFTLPGDKNIYLLPQYEIAVQLQKRIYELFGVSENILQNKATDNEANSFYENVIEPIAIELSSELTTKLLTHEQRRKGLKIVCESNNLYCLSMQTKLQMISLVDRGVITPNELRSVLGKAPISGGDTALLRKDTGVLTQPT